MVVVLRSKAKRFQTSRHSPSNKSERFEPVSVSSCSLSVWDRGFGRQDRTMSYTERRDATEQRISALISVHWDGKTASFFLWRKPTRETPARHSLERQTANVAAYCQRTGLELAEVLIDEGFSAYKGEHLSRGKLGKFLKAADKGKYKDHALIVEQLDRLSRLGITETSDLLRRILKAGLEVHVSQTGRVIRNPDDITTALLNVLESWSAEEYSRKLRERVSSAWASKQRNAVNGVSLTNKLPGWLEGRTGEPITVNEPKAAVVRQIFELTAGGLGKRAIAARLNQDSVPTFGGGKRKTDKWIHSYVQKLLANRAVLGEYQPKKGTKADGEPRIGFYPAVVTPELWQRAHEAITSRRATTASGAVTGKYGGRTSKMTNVFTGLVFDVTEPANRLPMHYKTRGKGTEPRLETFRNDGKKAHSVFYADFEEMALKFFDQLDWAEVLDVTENEDLKRAEDAIASLDFDIAQAKQRAKKIGNLLIDMDSPTLREHLSDTEAQLKTDKANREAAEKRLADLRQRNRDLLDPSVAYAKLAASRDLTTRAKLRDELRRKVKCIEMTFDEPYKSPYGTARFANALITFVNDAHRAMVFESGGAFMTAVGEPLPPRDVRDWAELAASS
jgi:DNA invertase Pin-like site-specific DNA recombinase